MASLGHCLELLEKVESCILLELRALHEGAWIMDKFMAFSQQLVMPVMLELHALLKATPKAHLELQAMMVDVQQYKQSWIVGVHPPCLRSWTPQRVPQASGRMCQMIQSTQIP